jgi:hypothetical protein
MFIHLSFTRKRRGRGGQKYTKTRQNYALPFPFFMGARHTTSFLDALDHGTNITQGPISCHHFINTNISQKEYKNPKCQTNK